MKRQILFLFITAITFLTSCSVFKTSTSKTMDIYGAGIIQKPEVVDLDVKEKKVTGTAVGSHNESFETIKQNAVADALKKANADVLIEPKFQTETTNGTTTATATGFPANYRNFRPIKAEDLELLKAGIVQKADVYEPPVEKKKSSGGAVLGVLLGLGLVILLATSL